MEKQQINLQEIAKEQIYCDIISKRNSIILTMAQEIQNLKNELEQLKEKEKEV